MLCLKEVLLFPAMKPDIQKKKEESETDAAKKAWYKNFWEFHESLAGGFDVQLFEGSQFTVNLLVSYSEIIIIFN